MESSAAAIGAIYDAIRVEGVGNNEALIPQGPLADMTNRSQIGAPVLDHVKNERFF